MGLQMPWDAAMVGVCVCVCRLREGGWGSTQINFTPNISPGRRLREFPTTFTADVLFIKLSHSSLCFTVTQHVEAGNEGHTQKQDLTHPQAGDTLSPAWLSHSLKHLDRLWAFVFLDQLFFLSSH